MSGSLSPRTLIRPAILCRMAHRIWSGPVAPYKLPVTCILYSTGGKDPSDGVTIPGLNWLARASENWNPGGGGGPNFTRSRYSENSRIGCRPREISRDNAIQARAKGLKLGGLEQSPNVNPV
jgi:hypothetical protein